MYIVVGKGPYGPTNLPYQHLSVPLSKADGEPKGGTETGLSLEQADHLPPVKQRERSKSSQIVRP